MVRVLPWVLVLASALLGPTGCANFGKRSGDSAKADPSTPAKFPGGTGPSAPAPDPILQSAITPVSGETTALLAGRVIDGFNRPPTNAFVQWVCTDGKESGAPIDVAVNPEGYFTIQGLKSGANYKLLARAKSGDKMLAGMTYTTAPNIRVVIRVSEDLATPNTPTVPGTPAFQPKTSTAPGPDNAFGQDAVIQGQGWSPGGIPVPAATPKNTPSLSISQPRPTQEGDLPMPVYVPVPNGPSDQGWVPGIAEAAKTWPPMLEIPKKPGGISLQKPVPIPDAGPTTPTPPSPLQSQSQLDVPAPARVPSCVLLGKRLVNFALFDTNGQPWEFRTHKKGKLILLDFWATSCIPCRESMPHLRQLQQQYGPQGLEVIGIACENSGAPADQAQRVASMCQNMQIGYRQLLSSTTPCPVRAQFGVNYVPTLILVDDQGWILWRHESKPQRATLDELERLIQRRLGLRN